MSVKRSSYLQFNSLLEASLSFTPENLWVLKQQKKDQMRSNRDDMFECEAFTVDTFSMSNTSTLLHHLSVVQLSVHIDLSLGDVTRQVRNRMSDV